MEIVPKPVRPELNILLLLGVVCIGFVVIGPMLGILLAMPFYEGTMFDLLSLLSDPIGHPEVKIPFFIIQGTTTLVGLVVAPALFIMAKQQSLRYFTVIPPSHAGLYLLTSVVTITFMVANSPFAEWNADVQFPEFLKGFEDWARSREDFATRITEFLTTFDSTAQLIAGLIVIAVLPALGEELVFRGLLQPQLHKNTGNIHTAIWISAFLFSAMHLQLFGFVPRMLLGALFGYLYYWSGNFWIAVLAHFVNNGFLVLMLYFQQQGISKLDMNSTEAAPWSVVVGASFVTFILLYLFKKQADRDGSTEIQ